MVKTLRVADKGVFGDVVTDVDHEAERLIIGKISEVFPDHRILSEESGELPGSAEWTWLVDPLDGTNNVVLGLPLFGVCVTLCHMGIPVVTAVYAGHCDKTYAAVHGGGATRNGEQIRLQASPGPERTTLSWIQGYGVRVDDPVPRRALSSLDRRFKRILQLWAPSVDWALLADGRTGAVVAYENELEDLLGGVLIAAEAGAIVTDFAGNDMSDLSSTSRLVIAAPEISRQVTAALSAVE
jgi:myo-inositol-1(or 4)-monophosphatase